jgi:hypothetical protein
MKATSTAPKMPKSPEFIPLNPIHGMQLIRSLSANFDGVLSLKKISGSDPGKLGPTDIPRLTLVPLLLVQIGADIAITPIILNTLLHRVKSVPPHIKKSTVKKTADLALTSSQTGSKKEAQIHQHEYSSRMDKVTTGLLPKWILKPQRMYPDGLGLLTLNNGLPKPSFITVTPCFLLGKKTPIVSEIDTVGLRPAFT